ncbi:cobalt ABC transporter permease [Carbonactinospora thermoautotrophica]|uniref:Cobalt ABC transporter permease n=1 Tax=Carbonactinospora thermoautotrophica TaxID=1469144 RepID=A0A132MZZ2_9ACTN|nr:cobalt ECF transporter T component CbiQ [Carbonactinospora thermoautotrophica]KWX03393.1 cobalt ABC transporter permease [Carbonactinospora thermoautotrophica]KWX05954.1 cobalt ABC transporter permease [Carbonactinospora thermoautotrophica]
MGGAHQGHTHRLYRHGHSLVHRLPPQVKIVALVGFVLVVVATPREQFWAFGAYALLLAAVGAVARVPPGFVLRRLVIEVPFLAFAAALPFVAIGERVHFLGVSLSVPGLYGAWNILVKGTLGVAASILLAATTELREILLGLERLRLPRLLVQIAAFMLRYADVVTGEMERMRIARESRGFRARDLRQAPVLARSLGSLFIRSYERGERVYLAMLSRGYSGSMPVLVEGRAAPREWLLAAVLPAAALLVCLTAWAR